MLDSVNVGSAAYSSYSASSNKNGSGNHVPSSASSFFPSRVVRSIFGTGNSNNKDGKRIMRKIRSQAPSFRQNCSTSSSSTSNSSCANRNNTNTNSSNTSNTSTTSQVIDYSSENKFLSILIDFAYLSNPDQFEGAGNSNSNHNAKLNVNGNGNAMKGNDDDTDNTTIGTNTTSSISPAEQEHIEREFATKYQTTLKKFYTLFTDIYHYYTDIEQFITELDNGHFVEYTLRSLLLESVHARQLICEVLYLYGTLLVMLDIYIPVSFFFCII